MSVRVIVSSEDLSDGLSVKAAVSLGYGSDISSQIEHRQEDFATSLAYAIAVGAIGLTRPYPGIDTYEELAGTVYPDILVSMPLGSNSLTELLVLESLGVIVSCRNELTSWGPGLEFLTHFNGGGSSAAAGYILGQLLRIKDNINQSWSRVRQRARATASNQAVWNKFTGFGAIDVIAACEQFRETYIVKTGVQVW